MLKPTVVKLETIKHSLSLRALAVLFGKFGDLTGGFRFKWRARPASILQFIFFTLLSLLAISSWSYTREGARVAAATSSTLNFQARLLNASGSLVTDGFYNIEFKLYSASSGGSALWTETYYDSNGGTAGNDNRLRVKNGYFSANLGSITSFPSLNWDQDLWLSMNVGDSVQTGTPTWDGEMSPRIKLTAVPYAFRAGQLAKLTGSDTSTLDFATQTGARSILLPDASGTLAIATGGSFTSNGVLYGDGTTSIQATAAGTTGQCLVATTSAAPSWGSCAGSGSGVTLQAAYDNSSNPATITTADGKNLRVTLQDTTTDQTLEISQAGTALAFRINDDGTYGDSTPFVVDASGRVGIGTVAPGSALEVNGDIYLSKEGTRTIKLADSTTSSTAGGQLNILGANGIDNSGGNINIQAGTVSSGTGNGGNITVAAGAGSASGFSNGGTISLTGGDGIIFGGGISLKGGLGLVGRASISLQSSGGSVGIGTDLPANILSVSPSQYNTGTAGTGNLASTTVTGSGTSWTSAMVGSEIAFANLQRATITAVASSTSLTVATSVTVPNGTAYLIQYVGLQVTSTGNVGIGDTSPSALLTVGAGDLFQVNASGAIAAVTGITTSGGYTQSGTGANTFSGASTFSASGTALSVTNNAYIGGNLSIGTTSSFGQLTLGNNQWILGVNAAGTAGINMFKINADNQIQAGAAISIDGGITLPTNAGYVTLVDLPIDSSVSAGTAQGYAFRIGSSNVMTVYGEADGSGNSQNLRVGIGNSAPDASLEVTGGLCVSDSTADTCTASAGDIRADGAVTANAFDIAERYASMTNLEPGTLVTADPARPMYVKRYDPGSGGAILGIVSSDPGFVLGWENNGVFSGAPYVETIALAGRVPVRVTDENGPINPGDTLMASNAPGLAKRAVHGAKIIGIALTPHYAGQGLVEVFVRIETTSFQDLLGSIYLQNGDAASFRSLNISGYTTLNSLKVQGDVEIEGRLVVRDTVVRGELLLEGRLSSKGSAPTVKKGLAAGEKGEITVEGTDTAGTITIRVKARERTELAPAESLVKGEVLALTFTKPYLYMPRVTLTASNESAVTLPFFVNKTRDGFKIVLTEPATTNTEYQLDYITVGSDIGTTTSTP